MWWVAEAAVAGETFVSNRLGLGVGAALVRADPAEGVVPVMSSRGTLGQLVVGSDVTSERTHLPVFSWAFGGDFAGVKPSGGGSGTSGVPMRVPLTFAPWQLGDAGLALAPAFGLEYRMVLEAADGSVDGVDTHYISGGDYLGLHAGAAGRAGVAVARATLGWATVGPLLFPMLGAEEPEASAGDVLGTLGWARNVWSARLDLSLERPWWTFNPGVSLERQVLGHDTGHVGATRALAQLTWCFGAKARAGLKEPR